MVSKALFSSETGEWSTPQDLFDRLHAERAYTLDPCATKENAKCAKFYTKEDSCFLHSWKGERVFMNPVYGEPEHPCRRICTKKRCVKRGWHTDVYIPGAIDFVRYAVEQWDAYKIVLDMLLPVRTDTEWFQDWIYPFNKNKNCDIDFLRGRLKFGGADNPAPFPSMIVTFMNW